MSIIELFLTFYTWVLQKSALRVGKALGRQQVIGFQSFLSNFSFIISADYLIAIRIWITQVFYWKFLKTSNFTPFWRFNTFSSHLFHFFCNVFIRLLNCYNKIYGLHRFSIGNSSKLPISHLFWRFYTFFTTFFQFFFYHIIRLLNCYQNIYGLHRISSGNS